MGQKLGLGQGRDLQGPLQPPPSAPHLILSPRAASDLLAAGAPIAAAPAGHFQKELLPSLGLNHQLQEGTEHKLALSRSRLPKKKNKQGVFPRGRDRQRGAKASLGK